MMRQVAFIAIDMIAIALMLAAQLLLGFPIGWLLFLIPCWLVVRLWWFYRQSVNQGLFDD